MSTPLTISLLAIMATPQVTEGIKKKTIDGGELAENALEMCLEDPRNMEQKFYLEVTDGAKGTYHLACQMLETTTGPFYAVKGEYVSTPVLKSLVELFEEQGINITEDEVNRAKINE